MNSFDPDLVTPPAGHFVDGELLFDATGTLPVFRPSDGRQYAELPRGGADLIDRMVESAKTAQVHWAKIPPRERIAVLRNWAEKVRENAVELGRIEALGSTRPISEVLKGDIPHLIETILFFAELADKRGGTLASTSEGSFGFTTNEPLGIVGAILPWNYPLGVAGWKLAPALAAGNAVIVKPSELTPFSVVRLAQLAIEAGLPVGLLNVVQGIGPETGSFLVRHPDVNKITFTGSTCAGKLIAEEMAKFSLKPMTLELGGKSPQVVFADADIEKTATAIVRSILNNGGQECVAGSRVLVEKCIEAELTEVIVLKMLNIQPGETWNSTTSYPPIISANQFRSVQSDLALALSNGAHLLSGGSRLEGFEGHFLQPTAIQVTAENNPILDKEIFASVLTFQAFEGEVEAIHLANKSSYALAAGLHTADLSRALRVMKRLDAGTIWINRYGRTDDFIIPTGGFKQSGTGKDLGIEAFDANLRVKSVLIGL